MYYVLLMERILTFAGRIGHLSGGTVVDNIFFMPKCVALRRALNGTVACIAVKIYRFMLNMYALTFALKKVIYIFLSYFTFTVTIYTHILVGLFNYIHRHVK